MKNNGLLLVLCLVCVLAVAGMALALSLTDKRAETAAFVPPPFDTTAHSGMPEVSDSSWTRIYQDGMPFAAYVCGEVMVSDGCAEIYFTSEAENTVWLKLRVYDGDGRILGETGLIRPGEYVKTITLGECPPAGSPVTLKIMAYEPETYYSAGAVSLHTTLG